MLRLNPPSPPECIITNSPSAHSKLSVMIRLRPKPAVPPSSRRTNDNPRSLHHHIIGVWASAPSSNDTSTSWPDPVTRRARIAASVPMAARKPVP